MYSKDNHMYFPWTQNDGFNLEAFAKILRDLKDEWLEWKEKHDVVIDEWESMKAFIVDYFENLDVSKEVNERVDALIESGIMRVYLSGQITDIIEDWLHDNISTSSAPVDTSLSIHNAAADSATVGDLLFPIAGNFNHLFELADTYFYHREELDYGQDGTPFDSDWAEGNKKIDCSSYMLLLLAGIPYEQSPYCGFPLKRANTPWACNFKELFDVRNTGEILRFFERCGKTLRWDEPDENVEHDYNYFKSIGLRPGDMILYARKRSDGTWISNHYKHCNHIAMVRHDRGDRFTMLEATSSSSVVIPNYSLEGSNTTHIAGIIRPDLGDMAVGTYTNFYNMWKILEQ